MSLLEERPATADERAFGEWAGDRFKVVASYATRPGDEQVEVVFMIKEAEIDGKPHALMNGPYKATRWPEHWEHMEAMLNAGWGRYLDRLFDDGA